MCALNYLERRKAKLCGPGSLKASTSFCRFDTPVLPSSRTNGLPNQKRPSSAVDASHPKKHYRSLFLATWVKKKRTRSGTRTEAARTKLPCAYRCACLSISPTRLGLSTALCMRRTIYVSIVCLSAKASHQEFSLHMEPMRSRLEVKLDTTTMRSSPVFLISLIRRNSVSILLQRPDKGRQDREGGTGNEKICLGGRWRTPQKLPNRIRPFTREKSAQKSSSCFDQNTRRRRQISPGRLFFASTEPSDFSKKPVETTQQHLTFHPEPEPSPRRQSPNPARKIHPSAGGAHPDHSGNTPFCIPPPPLLP